MEAISTILTHFSQRYPKAISLDEDEEAVTNSDPYMKQCMCTAFDGMEINCGLFPHLRLLHETFNESLDSL